MSQQIEAAESRWAVARSRFRKLASDSLSTRMLGFAASQAWVYVVLFSNSILENSAVEDLVHSSFYNGSLFFLVATFVLCGLAPRLFEKVFDSDLGCWAVGILTALGTFCAPLAGSTSAGFLAFLVATVTTGLGSGMMLVFWGKTYGEIGGPAAAGEAAIAFMLASLVQPMIVFFPVPVRIVIAMLLILASSALLVVTKHRSIMAEPSPVDSAAEGARASTQTETPRSGLDSSFVRMMVSSLLLGVCTAIMQAFFNSNDTALHDTLYTISMPVASLLAGLLLIGTLLFSKHLDLAFSYQPILLLIVLGCFFSIFLGEASLLACCTVMWSYQCFGLINWVLCADYCFNGSTSPIRVYGFGRGALSGGVLVGHILIPWALGIADMNFASLVAVGFGLVFLATIACTLVFTPQHLARVIRRHWVGHEAYIPQADDDGEQAPPDVATPASRELTLDDKIAFIAEEYEVSGRAREVLELLAHGRSGTRIEQELYMSKGTVKTHTRRIYQKLDVHSKQELLDLIESVQPSEVDAAH